MFAEGLPGWKAHGGRQKADSKKYKAESIGELEVFALSSAFCLLLCAFRTLQSS
jgi:hypothetical protein